MPTINKGKWGNYHIKDDKRLFFYPNEWLRLMELCNEKQKLSFMILINTGARINEARHLRPMDIQFARNNLTLVKTKVRSKLKEKRPTPRTIPVSSQFTKFLRKVQKQYKLKDDDYYPMLKNQALCVAIKQLAKAIGRHDWKDFSVHNVRKTHENYLLAIGVDGFKVARALGHSAQTALSSYVSPDIFNNSDRMLIGRILGDVYMR